MCSVIEGKMGEKEDVLSYRRQKEGARREEI